MNHDDKVNLSESVASMLRSTLDNLNTHNLSVGSEHRLEPSEWWQIAILMTRDPITHATFGDDAANMMLLAIPTPSGVAAVHQVLNAVGMIARSSLAMSVIATFPTRLLTVTNGESSKDAMRSSSEMSPEEFAAATTAAVSLMVYDFESRETKMSIRPYGMDEGSIVWGGEWSALDPIGDPNPILKFDGRPAVDAVPSAFLRPVAEATVRFMTERGWLFAPPDGHNVGLHRSK